MEALDSLVKSPVEYVCVEKPSLTDSITSYLWIESRKQLKIRSDLGGKEVAAILIWGHCPIA
ncbi:hypothetical protein IGI04_018928 [Brassica rapa subsp. trilocularis]|uniref:Uncharacterized protein n=1 Tax=Brassica rapa subsp. trilocularis TaxID=1813537 RepID=A0ABQ7MED4_BRACM|nr:hypothetical protein IGI04_018928 [Brassica rapa subsp. trilocularis]